MKRAVTLRLKSAVEQAASILATKRIQLVLAESCTAGLVAASLATVPGISRFLCGSFVTYQEAAKIAWLGVEPRLLAEHTAVSEAVTRRMAERSLLVTEGATWAVAVTGHLGPDAPDAMDGAVFVSVQSRHWNHCQKFQLEAVERESRQREAVCLVLEELVHAVAECEFSN